MSGHQPYLNFLFRFSVQFAVVDGIPTLDFHLIPVVHSLNPTSRPNSYEIRPRTTPSVEITNFSMNTSPMISLRFLLCGSLLLTTNLNHLRDIRPITTEGNWSSLFNSHLVLIFGAESPD
ncbi:hypothetical protein AB4424_11955 [Vibrio splendidus]